MTMNNVTNISNSSTYFVATFVTNIDVVSSWCHERENHLKRKTRLKDTGCTLFRYICKNQPTQALFIRLVSDDSIWYHYLISLSVKKDHFGSYRLAVIEKYQEDYSWFGRLRWLEQRIHLIGVRTVRIKSITWLSEP